MRAVLVFLLVGHCWGDTFGIDVPYFGFLPPKSFHIGKSIRIEGQLKMQPNYFVVNLQAGNTFSPYPTIALHFNPRYSSHDIHVNAWKNGAWGPEEILKLDMDLLPGKNFTLVILCGMTSYGVYLNKRLLTEFKFRVDPDIADTVYVNGDLKLLDIVIEDFGAILEGERLPTDKNTQSYDSRLVLPYYGLLAPKSFHVGMRLRIEGLVNFQPAYFVVNLMRGYKIWPYPIVALHFNPRYKKTHAGGTIHLNAWHDGGWGTEQIKQLDADLLPGRNFTLVIEREVSLYEVHVNGKLFSEFPFQTDPDIVDTVYVNGNIHLWDVALEDNASAPDTQEQLFQHYVETVPVYSNNNLGTIKDGLSFIVTGYILPHCDVFEINLLLGAPSNDIALHVSAHLSQNYIVCNSRTGKVWGSAEVSSSLPFNLHRDSIFTIQILITETSYVISVNGRHFTEFIHRLPYRSIASIKVVGNVKNIVFNYMQQESLFHFSPRSMSDSET